MTKPNLKVQIWEVPLESFGSWDPKSTIQHPKTSHCCFMMSWAAEILCYYKTKISSAKKNVAEGSWQSATDSLTRLPVVTGLLPPTFNLQRRGATLLSELQTKLRGVQENLSFSYRPPWKSPAPGNCGRARGVLHDQHSWDRGLTDLTEVT